MSSGGASSFLYLSEQDVEAVSLSMEEMVALVEAVFEEKGRGRVEMPPKPGIHTRPNAFIHAMPAYVPSLGAAGMKWVSGYPENHKLGLPYISGLLILNDPQTGLPIMVSDCTWITAMRTGAASAVAAKFLARKDSTTMAMIGCGVQGKSHVLALRVVLPKLNRVRAYDIRKDALDDFERWVKETFGDMTVERVFDARTAMVGAEIVITAGPILKDPTPIIEDEWFEVGAFACPIDFDSYWTGDALRGCDFFATDDVGQLFYYREQGYFAEIPEVNADLGEIVAGLKPGRTSSDQRIIAMNLGIALEDMAVAIRIYEQAKAQGIGRELPL